MDEIFRFLPLCVPGAALVAGSLIVEKLVLRFRGRHSRPLRVLALVAPPLVLAAYPIATWLLDRGGPHAWISVLVGIAMGIVATVAGLILGFAGRGLIRVE